MAPTDVVIVPPGTSDDDALTIGVAVGSSLVAAGLVCFLGLCVYKRRKSHETDQHKNRVSRGAHLRPGLLERLLVRPSANNNPGQFTNATSVLNFALSDNGEMPPQHSVDGDTSTKSWNKNMTSMQSHRSIISKDSVQEDDFFIDPQMVVVKEQIAGGAGGTVFLGEYQGNKCAVKILHRKELETSTVHVQREATILARLRHPNLISFWGFSIDTDMRCLLVMEYCPRNLQEVLGEHQTGLPDDLVQKYAVDIQKALEFLHRHFVLHRDLKPSNLLIDKDGLIKLCDFGLARHMQSNAPTFQMTRAVGTPFYMAPEVFNHVGVPSATPTGSSASLLDHPREKSPLVYGSAADVFSFGIVCWQMWGGKQPYSDTSFTSLFAFFDGVLKGHRPSLEGYPPMFAEMIGRCWKTDPTERPVVTDLPKWLTHPELLQMQPTTLLASLDENESEHATDHAVEGTLAADLKIDPPLETTRPSRESVESNKSSSSRLAFLKQGRTSANSVVLDNSNRCACSTSDSLIASPKMSDRRTEGREEDEGRKMKEER
jgi:serine/threonine protein kinase